MSQAFTEQFEGFSPVPYLDPGGIPSIAFGSIWDHRIPGSPSVTMQTPPVSKALGREWLASDLEECAKEISDNVHVPLTIGERIALEDFIYNLGLGNFNSSTLLRKLNQEDYVGAGQELLRWDHDGGKVLRGLLLRREAELALWKTGGNS